MIKLYWYNPRTPDKTPQAITNSGQKQPKPDLYSHQMVKLLQLFQLCSDIVHNLMLAGNLSNLTTKMEL